MGEQMSERKKIVIAGGGPVGMVGALRLALAGLSVTVLEQGADLAIDSKASTFHPPTLELLEQIDLIDEVLAQGLQAPVFQQRTREGEVLANLDLAELSGDTKYPFRIQLEQSKLTRIIRPVLEKLPNVELLFDQHVDRAEDAGDHARVFVNGSDTPIETEWLIGCDGANSMVRQGLGFEFDGVTFPERFLVMSTTHDFRQEMPDLAYVAYITDPDEWLVLLKTPDHWRCLMPVPADEPDEIATTVSRIQERLQGAAPIDGEYEVLQHSIYKVHQRVASDFSQNRVLIAGDSAHMNNPLGGMGMNSGIHDVWSAVDTIIAVERDGKDWQQASEIYGRVRAAACHEYVQAQTTQNFKDMQERDRAVRAARDDIMRNLMVDAEARRAYLLKASMLTSARATIAQVQSELAAL
jgi:2-polyprenyl-6-methoxyphenol hydroxylase-like FAD-dependent oxidoreductase